MIRLYVSPARAGSSLHGWSSYFWKRVILLEELSEIQVQNIFIYFESCFYASYILIYVGICIIWCNNKLYADDPKNDHLKELEGAMERLILCKADLLDFKSLCDAINGCDGVFHTASPVTDDPVSD